nr:hypothetical protein BaRGS_024875 [Batillaria attramentaria]
MTCQIANDLANEFLTELSNQIANDLASAREANEVTEAIAAATLAAGTSSITEPTISLAAAMNSSPNRANERLAFERLSPPSTNDRPSFSDRLSPHSPSERMAYNERINLLSSLTNNTLMFHERCGTLIKLGNGRRTAERRRPLEEFNNGVVMTNRPLRDDELFEIRLDRLVDKWSGSIEVGITTHNPNTLDFPATMTNMRSRSTNRTIMMSGCGILTNGKGTRREYGQFNLDELTVTILDRHDPNYPNNPPAPERRANSLFRHYPDLYDEEALEGELQVILSGQRPGEMFEVRLDSMVNKWAGSIEIGVTLHQPQELDYPSTMTNIRSGTWMMTGNGVMHNGTTVIDEYGQNLDRLKVTDRVGVLRKPDGTLHFYVNGVDQGVAASNVPENVYGVIDLYGQAAQATIVDQSDLLSSPEQDSSVFVDSDELKFHSLHGRNAAVINNGHTAVRTNDTGEFNDAIVMSSRALRDNELFEVVIEKLVERWSGVTMVKPEDIDFPSTMTDIQFDTWMLSGAAIMQDGATIHNGYSLDLDTINVGTRIGMMRCSDGTLHFYRDGMDQGVACTDIPTGVYAVVDLYGLCAQVSISSGSGVRIEQMGTKWSGSLAIGLTTMAISDTTSPAQIPATADQITSKVTWIISGSSVGTRVGVRRCSDGTMHLCLNGEDLGIAASNIPKVRIENLDPQWSGSLQVGVIGFPPDRLSFPGVATAIKRSAIVVQGQAVFVCGAKVKENYGCDLSTVQCRHMVGIMVDNDACLHVFVNGHDQGVAARDIPQPCYALFDLYGQCTQITMIGDEAISSQPAHADEREKADLEDDGYFDPQQMMCFCEACHKLRGEDLYHKRGEPPRDYALPYGWCRYVLRAASKAHALNVAEKWHTAYHGTRLDLVRRILDRGDLLVPSDTGSVGSILLPEPQVYTEKSRPENLESQPVFFSPTLRYAGSPDFCPKHRFVDPRSRKTYQARVAFQVWVKPGSYKVGGQGQGSAEDIAQQVDPHFRNSELAWSTKERGSLMLHALLFRVE